MRKLVQISMGQVGEAGIGNTKRRKKRSMKSFLMPRRVYGYDVRSGR